MEKAIVCFRCIGDRRLYKATATQPPALGEYRSRCGEKATLDLEARRVGALFNAPRVSPFIFSDLD